jgi:DNA-binding XRE family transcriptional regulator
MRTKIKIPRIIKIIQVNDFEVHCMFNNGEKRLLDFNNIFETWNISENDIEYPLLNIEVFKKMELKNYTLSWPSLKVELKDENGSLKYVPFEIGADSLYECSKPLTFDNDFFIGRMIKNARIKAGLTQEEVAKNSGTTRHYISKVENNKTDLELSTLKKIIEAGIGKKLILSVK